MEFLERSLNDLKNAKSNAINPRKIDSKKLNDSEYENVEIKILK